MAQIDLSKKDLQSLQQLGNLYRESTKPNTEVLTFLDGIDEAIATASDSPFSSNTVTITLPFNDEAKNFLQIANILLSFLSCNGGESRSIKNFQDTVGFLQQLSCLCNTSINKHQLIDTTEKLANDIACQTMSLKPNETQAIVEFLWNCVWQNTSFKDDMFPALFEPLAKTVGYPSAMVAQELTNTMGAMMLTKATAEMAKNYTTAATTLANLIGIGMARANLPSNQVVADLNRRTSLTEGELRAVLGWVDVAAQAFAAYIAQFYPAYKAIKRAVAYSVEAADYADRARLSPEAEALAKQARDAAGEAKGYEKTIEQLNTAFAQQLTLIPTLISKAALEILNAALGPKFTIDSPELERQFASVEKSIDDLDKGALPPPAPTPTSSFYIPREEKGNDPDALKETVTPQQEERIRKFKNMLNLLKQLNPSNPKDQKELQSAIESLVQVFIQRENLANTARDSAMKARELIKDAEVSANTHDELGKEVPAILDSLSPEVQKVLKTPASFLFDDSDKTAKDLLQCLMGTPNPEGEEPNPQFQSLLPDTTSPFTSGGNILPENLSPPLPVSKDRPLARILNQPETPEASLPPCCPPRQPFFHFSCSQKKRIETFLRMVSGILPFFSCQATTREKVNLQNTLAFFQNLSLCGRHNFDTETEQSLKNALCLIARNISPLQYSAEGTPCERLTLNKPCTSSCDIDNKMLGEACDEIKQALQAAQRANRRPKAE
jgi:hypothetical protein